MKNYFTAFALAAVLAIAGTAITTQPAEAHSSTGGKVAAGLGGLGLGLALGSMAKGPTYVYPAPAPVYAAPPAYYYPPPVAYAAPAYYPAYPAYYAPAPVYVR